MESIQENQGGLFQRNVCDGQDTKKDTEASDNESTVSE
jgi:hypothetical protein